MGGSQLLRAPTIPWLDPTIFASFPSHQSAVIPINPPNHTRRWKKKTKKLYEAIVIDCLKGNQTHLSMHCFEYASTVLRFHCHVSTPRSLSQLQKCRLHITARCGGGENFMRAFASTRPFPCQPPVQLQPSASKFSDVQFLTVLPSLKQQEGPIWLE